MSPILLLSNRLDESLLVKINFSKTYIVSECVENCRGDFFAITKSALVKESIIFYIYIGHAEIKERS